MIELVLTALGIPAAYVGAYFAHRNTKQHEKKCGAFRTMRVDYSDVSKQCPERADPRCLAGYCTPHCREASRCQGKCLEVYQKI